MGGCCIGDCCVLDCGFCCVMDFCSDSCCVGHSPSTGCGEDSGGGRSLGHTSVSNDSVGNAKRINEELNQMKEEFENKAAALEQMLIDQINASMDKFIDELETMNNQKFSGRALNINIKAIREKRQDLSKEVVGFIGTRLYDRIVTTDPELAPMLKEKDDKKRNANVKKFCEKVLREAKNDLKTQIRITIEAQQQVVRDVLENRLTEINKSLEKSTEAYQEILSAVEKDNVEQERLKLQYMYEYDVYNVLADEMGKFDDIKVGVRSNGKKIKVREQGE